MLGLGFKVWRPSQSRTLSGGSLPLNNHICSETTTHRLVCKILVADLIEVYYWSTVLVGSLSRHLINTLLNPRAPKLSSYSNTFP